MKNSKSVFDHVNSPVPDLDELAGIGRSPSGKITVKLDGNYFPLGFKVDKETAHWHYSKLVEEILAALRAAHGNVTEQIHQLLDSSGLPVPLQEELPGHSSMRQLHVAADELRQQFDQLAKTFRHNL